MYGNRFLNKKEFASHFYRTCWGNQIGEFDYIERDIDHWLNTGLLSQFKSEGEDGKEEGVFRYWQVYELETIRRERSVITDKNNPNHRIPFFDKKIGSWYNLRLPFFQLNREKFEILGGYIEALLSATEVTFQTGKESALEAMDARSEHEWLTFVHELCLQWRDYFDQGQVGIRNHLRDDIDALLDLLEIKFGLTFERLDTAIGQGRYHQVRHYYDSLLTWVLDGDLYAQQADATYILSANRGTSQNLGIGGGKINEDDYKEIVKYARHEDQLLLLHALSWCLNSDNKNLGRGYYYTEAIRTIREIAISIESMIDQFAECHGISLAGKTSLFKKACFVFGQRDRQEHWWHDCQTEFEALMEIEKLQDSKAYLDHLSQLNYRVNSIGQAVGLTCAIRNRVTHSARYSRETFMAAFTLLQDSAIVTLYTIWFWAKERGITTLFSEKHKHPTR